MTNPGKGFVALGGAAAPVMPVADGDVAAAAGAEGGDKATSGRGTTPGSAESRGPSRLDHTLRLRAEDCCCDTRSQRCKREKALTSIRDLTASRARAGRSLSSVTEAECRDDLDREAEEESDDEDDDEDDDDDEAEEDGEDDASCLPQLMEAFSSRTDEGEAEPSTFDTRKVGSMAVSISCNRAGVRAM